MVVVSRDGGYAFCPARLGCCGQDHVGDDTYRMLAVRESVPLPGAKEDKVVAAAVLVDRII